MDDWTQIASKMADYWSANGAIAWNTAWAVMEWNYSGFVVLTLTTVFNLRHVLRSQGAAAFKEAVVGVARTALWALCAFFVVFVVLALYYAPFVAHQAATQRTDIRLPAPPELTPVEAAELVSLRGRVRELETLVQELRAQLDDSAERKKLIAGLNSLAARLAALREMCNRLEPPVFEETIKKLIGPVVEQLDKAGYPNDARRLASGVAPQGFPARLAGVNCNPYNNGDAAWLLVIRGYLIDDIVRNLSR